MSGIQTYPPATNTASDHQNTMSHDQPAPRSRLEEYERGGDSRPPFVLNRTEVKLLGIAGVGFFLDAYDLFIINPVATMLQYRLYNGHSLPADLEGFMKAGANIGSVIGQFLFGYLADRYGRQKIYGKELMLIIFATILTLTVPTGSLSPDSCLIYLGCFRILLGIGVGGDYPMSATVTSDRASVRKRGTMLAYIFANQGWGSFGGSIAFIVVLAAYKHSMDTNGHTSRVDGIWRILVGISLIPAFGTLYQRLTLGESTRYAEARARAAQNDEDDIGQLKQRQDAEITAQEKGNNKNDNDSNTPSTPPLKNNASPQSNNKGQLGEFIRYFSEWRHGKVLLATAGCWFFLDIAFYGINLNQNVVLQQIGFDGKHGTPWHRLFKIAQGNLIVTALGFVPGYYATVLTIEKFGRKKIQLMGFLMEALFLAILAGKFYSLSKPAFIVVFALLQFFFNFGANTTTYVYPAEVFPTRFKALAHGSSAAAGKAGAIISALAFNRLSKSIGTPKVLWIFVACCLVGALLTLLLPEVRMRDADEVYEEELRERREAS